MKNCIKTVYPFSVENGNAPILGRLILHHYSGVNNESRLLVQGKGVLVSVSEPNYFTVSADTEHKTSYELTSDSVTEITFSTGEYDIVIDNKYNLTLLGTNSSGVKTDAVGMNINDAEFLVNLKGLRFVFTNGYSYGSIEKLGRLINLGFPGSQFNILGFSSKNIVGTIEGFVAGQVKNGRTNTGDFPIKTYIHDSSSNDKPEVTFGNKLITTYINANAWITWESTSKISIYAGTSVEASTEVYVRGYSASEITSNQASGEVWEGKTVTDVVSGTVYPPAN